MFRHLCAVLGLVLLFPLALSTVAAEKEKSAHAQLNDNIHNLLTQPKSLMARQRVNASQAPQQAFRLDTSLLNQARAFAQSPQNKRGPVAAQNLAAQRGAVGGGALSVEPLLKDLKVPYKAVGKGAYLVLIEAEGKKGVFQLVEGAAGPKDNPIQFVHLSWNIDLPKNFNAPPALYAKLNDLNNGDIFANITLIRAQDQSIISGDYAFPLVQGTGSPVMAHYLVHAFVDLDHANQGLAGFVQESKENP